MAWTRTYYGTPIYEAFSSQELHRTVFFVQQAVYQLVCQRQASEKLLVRAIEICVPDDDNNNHDHCIGNHCQEDGRSYHVDTGCMTSIYKESEVDYLCDILSRCSRPGSGMKNPAPLDSLEMVQEMIEEIERCGTRRMTYESAQDPADAYVHLLDGWVN